MFKHNLKAAVNSIKIFTHIIYHEKETAIFTLYVSDMDLLL